MPTKFQDDEDLPFQQENQKKSNKKKNRRTKWRGEKDQDERQDEEEEEEREHLLSHKPRKRGSGHPSSPSSFCRRCPTPPLGKRRRRRRRKRRRRKRKYRKAKTQKMLGSFLFENSVSPSSRYEKLVANLSTGLWSAQLGVLVDCSPFDDREMTPWTAKRMSVTIGLGLLFRSYRYKNTPSNCSRAPQRTAPTSDDDTDRRRSSKIAP